MIDNLPALLCVLSIGLFFVFPAWLYIFVTERRSRTERAKSIEAGRHEPVTIQPYVDLSLCMGAGACVTACPEGVLRLIDGQAVAVNMSACIGHGVCVPVCPVDAIQLVFGSDKRGIDIPEVGNGFESNVKGLHIAGELGGMGLIAAAADQGVQAMNAAAQTLQKKAGRKDVIIVGAGPAGLAAALVAKQKGLDYLLVDQGEVGGVVRHYPRKKLVFTRPMVLPLYGKVSLKQLYKEELVSLFEDIVTKCGIHVAANERVEGVSILPDGGFAVKTVNRTVEGQKVILALGRGGTPRKLDVSGEEQEKVSYSLLEPEHFQNEHLVVVGGGDSAVEAAMQLGEQPGNKVLLSYRGDKINRPKEKNIKRLKEAVKKGQVELCLNSTVKEIGVDRIVLDQQGESLVLPNDHVFVFAGGILPTKFLQDAGIRIQRHFGKRIEDADAKKKPKADAKEDDAAATAGAAAGAGAAATPGAVAKAGPPAEVRQPAPNSVPTALVGAPNLPTALVQLPPALDVQATAILPPHAEQRQPRPAPAAETTVPRASPADFGGDLTVPRAPRESDEATVPRASSFDLAPVREEDTNPPGSTPKLGDLATAIVNPAVVEKALERSLPPPAADSYDEAPIARDPEPPPRKREVTEIQPLRRVATVGSDRSSEPEAPASPPPTSPDGAVGRVVAGPSNTAVDPRAPARPVAPPQEPAGVTGLSRGISRAGRGPGAAPRPEPATPASEVRPESRRETPPLARERAPDSVPAPAPTRASAADPFLRAAEEHLAAGRFREVLQMTADLMGLVERAAAALSPTDLAVAERRVLELEGRAHLGLGDWASALPSLDQAAAVARGGDPSVLGAVLADLGRALHHAGRFDDALATLGEAAAVPGVTGPRRSAVLRLLGDLHLRTANVEEAERVFADALREASGSPTDQARAMRGRAHVAAVRGDLGDATVLLEQAARLLGSDGPVEVIAGIQARALELEIATGSYGKAFQRAEDLATTTARRRIVDQQAEAVSLLAEVLSLLGMTSEAAEAAGQVDALARHLGHRGAEARIRAARAACEVARHDIALRLLDAVDVQPEGVVDDLEGQRRAVLARALVRKDPAASRDLANSVLARPSPRLVIRSARIRLDAAMALLESGSPSSARAAVKRGLKDVQGAGTRGLKLELLVAMYLAEPDHRVVEAVARSALKILDELPDHCARPFRSRGVIANALQRWEDAGGR